MSPQQAGQIIENPMRKVILEKIVLSAGAKGQDLERARMLLEYLSNKKAKKLASTKRIPTFDVRPGLEVGVQVTLRGKEAKEILKRFLSAIDNYIDKSSVAENSFSFGIKEYIEIPGTEYKREIGIRGLNVTLVFVRKGIRVKHKKIKSGRLPHKQIVSKEEIIKYMGENFETEFE